MPGYTLQTSSSAAIFPQVKGQRLRLACMGSHTTSMPPRYLRPVLFRCHALEHLHRYQHLPVVARELRPTGEEWHHRIDEDHVNGLITHDTICPFR